MVGTSTDNIEDAIQTAPTRARKTLRNLDWFEVKEIRGSLADGYLNTYSGGARGVVSRRRPGGGVPAGRGIRTLPNPALTLNAFYLS